MRRNFKHSFRGSNFWSDCIIGVSMISMPLAGVGSTDTPNLSLSNVYHISKLTLNFAYVG